MSFNGDWEYYNQDYLKEKYEKKIAGELPDHPVRKIYCKGCGRVIKEGESAFAQGTSRADDREQDMTVEQIFCALDRMKGLNRRERERYARAASAV